MTGGFVESISQRCLKQVTRRPSFLRFEVFINKLFISFEKDKNKSLEKIST